MTLSGHTASFAAILNPLPREPIVELTDDGVLVNFASLMNASPVRRVVQRATAERETGLAVAGRGA